MKKMLSILTAFVLLCSFSGCSSSVVTKDSETITINTESSFSSTDAGGQIYEQLQMLFMQTNSNISIRDKSVTADDTWKATVRTEFAENNEPDVLFFFTAADASELIEGNKMVSIEEIREVYPDYALNVFDDVFNMVRESDGKAYAVPVKGFYEGLFCNDALFEQYNVPAITDWQSLINAIEIFNQNGVTPIAASFSDVPNYLIEHTILSAGGVDAHAQTPTTADEIPEGWSDGLDTLKELYDMGAFQSDCLSTKQPLAQQLFNDSQAAMILEGSWFAVDNTIVDDVSITPFPSKINSAGGDCIIAGYSMGYYITRKAWDNPEKRDACVKYVEYMTSNEAIASMCSTGGLVSANVKVNGKTSLVTKGAELSVNNKLQMPIDSRLNKTAWEYTAANITSVLTGKTSSKQLWNNALSQ